MAFMFANRGIYSLLNLATSGSTDIRQAVFKGAPPNAATVADYNFLSDVTAGFTEAAASGYARADLAGIAIAESDASDNATLVATAPTYTAVASGETWTFVAYYIFNASDAAAVLIGIDDPASDLITNGGNVTGPALSVTLTAGAGNFTFCNRGLYNLLALAISGSTDLRATPFTGTKPSAATVKDWNTLADAIADATSAESTFGSARFDLASVAITEDDTNDYVTIGAAAPTWSAVTAGETWTFVVYYVEAGTDATRELIAVDLTTTGQVTNGSNISYSALAVTVND